MVRTRRRTRQLKGCCREHREWRGGKEARRTHHGRVWTQRVSDWWWASDTKALQGQRLKCQSWSMRLNVRPFFDWIRKMFAVPFAFGSVHLPVQVTDISLYKALWCGCPDCIRASQLLWKASKRGRDAESTGQRWSRKRMQHCWNEHFRNGLGNIEMFVKV